MRIVALLSIVYLAFLAPYSQTPTANTVSNKPDQRFGMVEAFWQPEEAAELGVGWERILFYWRELQPTGPQDWNTLHVLEEWLVEADEQGRTVVGLLKNTAPWASKDGTEAGLPKGLYLPVNDPNNLWANFVRKTAAYYSARNVHHWIIWNEPEIRPGVFGHEFAGSINDYYQMLKVAYKVMKDVDPNAVIHLAGLTWWHDQGYLGRFLDVAIADPEGPDYGYFFDIISLHIYFRTETIRTVLNAVQAVQKEYGINKPVWINETNAPPNSDPLWPVNRPNFAVDLDQQAWFIVQSLALGFASGAERIGIYKLIDIHLPPGGESFGLVRPDLSHRPAFEAYKQSTHVLAGFNEVHLEAAPQYYVVTFDMPAGQTHILWSRTASPISVQVPAVEKIATLVDINGSEQLISADDGHYSVALDGARCTTECFIGGKPIILVEESKLFQRILSNFRLEGGGLELAQPSPAPTTRIGQTDPQIEDPTGMTAPLATSTYSSKTNSIAATGFDSTSLTSKVAASPTPSLTIEEPDQSSAFLTQEIAFLTEFESWGLILIGLALMVMVGVLMVWKLARK